MKRSCLALLCMASASHAAIKNATVFSEPSGYGQQYSYIVLEYDELLNAETKPRPDQFSVENHQIQETRLGQCIDQRKICRSHELILMLDRSQPDDRFLKVTMQSGAKSRPIERQPIFKIEQKEMFKGDFNNKNESNEIPAHQFETQKVTHLVAEQFTQGEFQSAGVSLKYNLFVPKNIEPQKHYPLIIFLHDEESVNSNTRHTLWQGNGATSWAIETLQSNTPAFVLAPQFDRSLISDDNTEQLETIMALIQSLQTEHPIDEHRLYLTGQMEGATMAIKLNTQYPNVFAASYLVSGKIAESDLKTAARTPLILLNSEKIHSLAEQDILLEQFALQGGQIQKAIINTQMDKQQLSQEIDQLFERFGSIYSIMLRHSQQTPQHLPIDVSKIAYELPAIQKWLLTQTNR